MNYKESPAGQTETTPDQVSVIVTACNVEDYIDRCLESILIQDFPSIEIIVVDDGSTDLTPAKADSWSAQYPGRITVIHTQHKGVGISRNTGLEAAQGDCIAFVDADDTVHKNMYSSMMKLMKNHHADLVICDVLLDETAIGGRKTVQYSINSGPKTKENYITAGVNLCSPCNKLFRKRLFKGHHFDDMVYEDMALIPVIVSEANKIIFTDKHYYRYMRRKGSISTSEFQIQDLWKAVEASVNGVAPEFRERMACWQARSLIDLANKEQAGHSGELEALVNSHRELFADNPFIRDDPLLSKILRGQLCQRAACLFPPELRLTVISDLDRNLIHNKVLQNISEEVQILSKDELHCGTQIRGAFVLCLDEYVELPETYITEIVNMDLLYGKTSFVYAVSRSQIPKKQAMINTGKKPEAFRETDYICAISTKAFIDQNCDIDFTSFSILCYALLKSPNICVIGNICSPLIESLSQDIKPAESEEIYTRLKGEVDALSKNMHALLSFYNPLPAHIQHYLMMRLRRYFETEYGDEIIRRPDFPAYRDMIHSILNNIDDDVILNLKKVAPEYRLFFFNMKYGQEAALLPSEEGLKLMHNGHCIWIQDETYTMFEFCDYKNGILRIEGRTICLNITQDEELPVFALVNSEYVSAKKLARDCSKYCLGKLLYKGVEFEFNIPIDPACGRYELRFYYMYRENRISRNDIRFGKFFPLTKRYRASYFHSGDRLLTYNDAEKSMEFRLWGRKGRIQKETAFLKELQTKFPPKEFAEIRKLRVTCTLRALFPFKKTNFWMISDKMSRGDDNGEAFFKYINSAGDTKRKVKAYYLMNKDSVDYNRIRKYGRVVLFNSYKHKLLSLICRYHFIAYANDAVTKPLLKYTDCFKDIMCREWIVFLQHGPTQNNISSALNKYNQNFAGIITINEKEYNSFLTYNYFYRNDQIKLTGFPRYDYLTTECKHYITFAPTWRRTLFGRFLPQEERYTLNDGFKNSEYYQFYSGVIHSPKLREAARRGNYELHFIPHPVFFPYTDEFDFGEDVIIHDAGVSYNRMFCESSMFITDYSSAVFDCAYLGKPIVYTQFDSEAFYKSQYKRGMFDYETDGFGPVTHTVDEAVDAIVRYMDNNCQMEEFYRRRVTNYFRYHDKENCSRIFNAFYRDET